MTPFPIGIRKRYTIPCYKITTAGSLALRMALTFLQLRQKWMHPKRNLAGGDIVLVASESHCNYWPLGRVVETFPDKRSFVRWVKVLTKATVYERPVDKFCLLVENESPSTGNVDTKN